MSQDRGSDGNSGAGAAGGTGPLDRLGVLAVQTVPIDEQLDHVEIYRYCGVVRRLSGRW